MSFIPRLRIRSRYALTLSRDDFALVLPGGVLLRRDAPARDFGARAPLRAIAFVRERLRFGLDSRFILQLRRVTCNGRILEPL